MIKYETKIVPIGQIVPSEDNPRKTFNAERLKELAESIKTIDLMEEIAVRQIDNSRYEIINGERRWRAERELLGNTGSLSVRVYNVDAVTAQEMRLTELSQREDVDQIEVENAVYKYWILRGKPRPSELVGKTGFSDGRIREFIKAGTERFPEDFVVDAEGLSQGELEPKGDIFDVSAVFLSTIRPLKDAAPIIYNELLKACASGLIPLHQLRKQVSEIQEIEPTQEDTLATIKQKKKEQEQTPKQKKPKPKETKPKKKQQPRKKPTLDEIKDKAPKIYEELKQAKSDGLITKKKEESLVKEVQEDSEVTPEDTLKDVTKRKKAKEKPKQEKPEPEWPEGMWDEYKDDLEERRAWRKTPEGRKRIEVSENSHRHFQLEVAIKDDNEGVFIFCPNCGKGKEFLGWMCCHTPADEAVKMAYEKHQKDIDDATELRKKGDVKL